MGSRGLIVHCSDTPNGAHYSARDIDRWHAARTDIAPREEAALAFQPQYPYVGYHGIILLDGTLVRTRGDEEHGSHCRGQNSMLGFCLIGLDKFTASQWATLRAVIEQFQPPELHGHHEFNPEKTCPGFVVADWVAGGMVPLAQNLL